VGSRPERTKSCCLLVKRDYYSNHEGYPHRALESLLERGAIPADWQDDGTRSVQVRVHPELGAGCVLRPNHHDFGIPVPCAKRRLSGFARNEPRGGRRTHNEFALTAGYGTPAHGEWCIAYEARPIHGRGLSSMECFRRAGHRRQCCESEGSLDCQKRI